MGYDDDYYFDDAAQRPRDVVIDQARQAVLHHVRQYPEAVFYSRQLEVLFERRFFHWITNKAVRELVNEGVLACEEVPLGESTRIRFVFLKTLRYYRRAVKVSAAIVRRYSHHEVAHACGEQADMLFLNALATRGFRCLGQDVNEFQGRLWTETNHDLDFIVERDGVPYGTEVKNTLDYIERVELRVKLRMCEELGLRPLMIMRAAPKTYIYEVTQYGGYTMVFGAQIYPFGFGPLVRQMQQVLTLPADCPRSIPSGIIDRFLRWHDRSKE
jgi:hypothetical protein